MTLEILAALALFAFVSSVTPGPNNLMLMASGTNYGFRRTLPHLMGVLFGFMFMVLMVGLGLMQVFDALPVSYLVLKVCSVLYLLYLAFKIATATAPQQNQEQGSINTGQPMTFWQAVLFQWVNPKGWTMALTAISVYASSRGIWAVAIVSMMFGLLGSPAMILWVVIGTKIRRWLGTPSRLQWFNWTMALLLVGSLYPVFVY